LRLSWVKGPLDLDFPLIGYNSSNIQHGVGVLV
jgi:hypothetical protein